MRFSERYGYKKVDPELLKTNLPHEIRARLWNIFFVYVFKKLKGPVFRSLPLEMRKFITILMDKFYKREVDILSSVNPHSFLEEMRDSILLEKKSSRFLPFLKWYEIYDFIEFFAEHYPDEGVRNKVLKQINRIFEEEKVPYRIINGIVTPLFQKEERKEIERAFDLPERYKPVMDHLEKALRHYSNRKNPDYENSIKESISALESLAQIILGKDGTLGQLVKFLNIHSGLKNALSNLYGWTSDEEGIRHAKTGEPLSAGPEEARFMLVTASAFVNYVVGKDEISVIREEA